MVTEQLFVNFSIRVRFQASICQKRGQGFAASATKAAELYFANSFFDHLFQTTKLQKALQQFCFYSTFY